MTLFGRVRFGQGFAYRPDEVLVQTGETFDLGDDASGDTTDRVLDALAGLPFGLAHLTEPERGGLVTTYIGSGRIRIPRVADPLRAVAHLREEGYEAQLNHVLFANPFYANPFYANPFYANPFYANPFYANPFYANPFYANADADGDCLPDESPLRTTARPSARPTKWPGEGKGSPEIRVVILDTGYATGQWRPQDHPNPHPNAAGTEVPDADGDDLLDAAAGHGTFIAGIYDFLARGCSVDVLDVVGPEGDGDEAQVALELEKLASADSKPHVVNLSFGGYACDGMLALRDSIVSLARHAIIVASAGNDGTDTPMYPAAFDEVIAVGALDVVRGAENGSAVGYVPASFTNRGGWVDACTIGVDIVSTFFRNWVDPASAINPDEATYQGWAVWNGTSFAAPRVGAVLARELSAKLDSGKPLDEDTRSEVVAEVLGAAGWSMPHLGCVVVAELPDLPSTCGPGRVQPPSKA